jgi:hypothetical protein
VWCPVSDAEGVDVRALAAAARSPVLLWRAQPWQNVQNDRCNRHTAEGKQSEENKTAIGNGRQLICSFALRCVAEPHDLPHLTNVGCFLPPPPHSHSPAAADARTTAAAWSVTHQHNEQRCMRIGAMTLGAFDVQVVARS